MATWDGSYQGDPPSDDFRYLCSNAQNNRTDENSWNDYNQPNNKVSDTNTLSTSLNVTQFSNDHLDNTNAFTIEVGNGPPGNFNRSSKNHKYNEKLSTFHSQIYDTDELRLNHIDDCVINNSKLHPGANEFIPSGCANVDTSKIFFADNKNRYDNRKFDNKRNDGTNHRQYEGEFQQKMSKSNDKSRKNHSAQHVSHSNSERNKMDQHLSNNVCDDNEESIDISNVKNNSKRNAHKGRRTSSHGRFQNDHYNGSRHFNNPSNSSLHHPNSSGKQKNNFANDMQSCEIEKQSKSRHRIEEKMSEDSRDDKYRENIEISNSDCVENDGLRKDKKRNIRGKDSIYSEDLRDERYHSKRNFYEEKSFKNKRVNYQEYNSYKNYERNSKSKIDDSKYKDESTSQSTDKMRNWRRSNHPKNQMKNNIERIDLDDMSSQKDRLTDQLNRGHLECLVCCEYIRQNDGIWSCNNCYHVLHLKCIKKWAESSQGESGWRCPACQNVNQVIPQDYFCFCGKTRDPEWNRRDVAHSCGEVCGRARAKNNCIHKCTLLCHPGSCPLCIAMVTRYCGCGSMSQSFKCSTDIQLSCDSICGKLLNCQIHKCQRKCHHDNCGTCQQMIHQECFCGKHNRDVLCQANTPTTFKCDQVCNKLLECGNHNCKKKCHPGECGGCPLKPEMVTHCCCGQSLLTIKRQNCLDPIPTCDKICARCLQCGQPNEPHTCQSYCHPGDCPQCKLTTWVKCRCGNMDREIPCVDLTTKADDARCEKKCTKKRSCGKHKCNQHCCIDIEHICPLQCSKTLSCGKHKCELTCHKGRCQPCYQSSFEELYCECGAAVIYPPVACGTRRPTCNRPCSRQHACGHEVLHNCHSDPNCPPCTVLTQKWCYGKHELRKAVPCYFNDISCGMPCGMPLECGRHKCISLCHPGSCKKPGQLCTQPCTIPREMCGHNCAAPCHEGKCPDTPCKEMVKVTCTCGNRSMTRACAENSREYQRIASGILASKMADMQLGHSVDLEEVFGQGAKKQNQLKTLECNDECKTIERNRRLALGLQIVNPDLSGKLLPRYTDYMKQWAKKDPNFCQMVHDKLTELVQLAKTSKQKWRSYSFDSMNRDKRHFIHEACEHFGCESLAYDQEPKRNVVATAIKDKCWLPSYSLLEMVQRESGQRKVPRPVLNIAKTNISSFRTSEVLPSTAKKSQKLQPTTSSKSPDQEIDYFDFPNSKWCYM